MKTSEKESGTSLENEGYFSILTRQIHTVIAATVDDENHPVTCAIDIMDYDENSLYFLTARGKGFYHRLRERPYIALTGVKGNGTMSSIAISIKGKARECDDDTLNRLLDKNKYMYEIYPTEESRKALAAFRIHEGTGEFFDLSQKPIVRKEFSFGGAYPECNGYIISGKCTGCGACLQSCPQQCISNDTLPFHINESNCLNCGRCYEVCPEHAVEKWKR